MQKNRLPNKANLEYVTYTFDTGKSDSGYIRFDNNGSTDNYNAFMFVGEVMLVEGSTARKYEKATEEVIDEISSVKAELKLTKKGLTGYFNKTDSNASSISTHTNQISALNNALSSKVSQTDYNTLTGRVTNAESQIQIQAGEISKRLTSTQVESAITAKGYQTKAQVDSNITGRGYITSSALQPYVTTTVLENKVKETSDSFNRTISAVRLEIPTNTSMRNLILKSSDKWGSYTSTNNANSNWCPEICRITLDSDRGVTVGKKLNLFVYISADNVALDSSSLHRIDVQAYIAKKDGTNLWHGDVPFHNQWGSKTLKAGNNYYVVRLTKEIKDTVYENGAQLVVQCRIDGANHVDYRHRAAMITTGDMFPDAWSPASEDLVTVVAFNNVSDTVDHHTQTLKDQEGRINMVLQTTTTAYQLLQDGGSIYEDLKTVKGQIQQVRDANYATRIETLAGSWAVKNLTSGGQMLNQINLLANGTNLIDGRLTHITGDTLIDRGVIKSAMIGNGQIGTAHIGTIDASQANIINLNVNTLVGFDTTFIKGKFDNVIADLLKGKTIVAQNDAMNVDLLNAKINLLADSSAIRRVFNGYPTQFIKYGTMIDSNGNKFSNTIIGSNRDGSENSGNATFSGIEIFNSATTSVEDYTKIYADKLYLKHDGGDHGWLVQTSNKQRIIPLDGTIPSEIMAKDFLMIYNDNGNATSLRDHIATLVHNITELANRTGGMTNIWSIKA
ncbi:gp58-like family protein [Streptococcus sp. FT1-55]|uniref:gp58-like family protein n=1 Tax=Streptococcus sp. FT1-55 TaxID=3409805 RepID=UPI003BF558A7